MASSNNMMRGHNRLLMEMVPHPARDCEGCHPLHCPVNGAPLPDEFQGISLPSMLGGGAFMDLITPIRHLYRPELAASGPHMAHLYYGVPTHL